MRIPREADGPPVWDSLVIGAGQAGLSASHHLGRLGIEHLVLDANPGAGGAWQHRWDALTMADVHGVADLPGSQPPPGRSPHRANRAIPAYFAAYERDEKLPIRRPVRVESVHPHPEGFRVRAATATGWQELLARTLISATGTWTRPFIPHYPGQASFAGTQLHTVNFPPVEWFAGKRTIVVGAGASAVQFLGLLAPVVGAANLLWATRNPPDWRHDNFTPEVGAAVVAQVQDRVAAGLAPRSVVSVTGLHLRAQEEEARRLGVYERRLPMFDRIEPTGVRWRESLPPELARNLAQAGGANSAAGSSAPVEVILWATGFRYAVEHLSPLHLRSSAGGIQLAADGTTVVAQPRVQLVGYGPSASTIGANRAGRKAALGVRRALQQGRQGPPPFAQERRRPVGDLG